MRRRVLPAGRNVGVRGVPPRSRGPRGVDAGGLLLRARWTRPPALRSPRLATRCRGWVACSTAERDQVRGMGGSPVGWPGGRPQGVRDRDRVRRRAAGRGRPEPGPRLVGADQQLRRAAQGGLGLRGRIAGPRRPRLRPGGHPGARDRDPPGQHRPHQRRPLLRRPRPPRVLVTRVRRRARAGPRRQGGGAGPGPLDASRGAGPRGGPVDRGLQEQLGREGQLVRLPRELPGRPGVAVLGAGPASAALVRDPSGVHRARARSAPRTARPRSTTSSASEPTSSKRRSGSRRR